MNQNVNEQPPVLDMDIPVTLKARDLIKLNQILARTYDEEEGLRETIAPILQEIRKVVQEIEDGSEWKNLNQWDTGLAVLEKAVSKQKKHLKRIKKALIKKQHLRISYCVPGTDEITKRTIIPLDLWESDSYWLLRAYCYLKGEEHTFRLDRILKLKLKAPGKKRLRPVIASFEEELAIETDQEPYEEPIVLDQEESEAEYFEDVETEIEPETELETETELDTDHSKTATEAGSSNTKNHHYSLPGKKPHQSGLPNRLERLIKRVERKTKYD